MDDVIYTCCVARSICRATPIIARITLLLQVCAGPGAGAMFVRGLVQAPEITYVFIIIIHYHTVSPIRT